MELGLGLSGAGEDAQLLYDFELVLPNTNGIWSSSPVPPIGRSGHCMAADDSDIYIFGGYNPKGQCFPLMPGPPCVLIELWKFNFCSRTWKKLDIDAIPDTCASSCLAAVNKRLFVYGGTGYPFGKMMSNTLKILDCRNLTGSCTQQHRRVCWHMLETNPNQYNALDCGDTTPPRAYGQSLIFHEDSIYVFGGAVGFYDEAVADLHRLNFQTMSWEKMAPTGKPPEGTYKQEIAQDSERFYIFGGGRLCYAASLETIHTYDFSKNSWGQIKTVADPKHGYPKARCSFGLAQTGKDVYICGGRHYEVTRNHLSLSDIWHFDLCTSQWTKLAARLPEPLYFHSVCVSPSGHLYLYGGVRGNGVRSDEIYRWKLPFFLTSLKELCWETMVLNFEKLSLLNKNSLLSLGIPCSFLQRLES